jgi:hypothetical protein
MKVTVYKELPKLFAVAKRLAFAITDTVWPFPAAGAL